MVVHQGRYSNSRDGQQQNKNTDSSWCFQPDFHNSLQDIESGHSMPPPYSRGSKS